jgi:hypothetical protein
LPQFRGANAGKEKRMNRMIATLAAASLGLTAVAPTTAIAQHRHDNRYDGRPDDRWRGGAQNRHWDPADSYRSGGRHGERRLGRNDEIYRGRDGRYYCRRNDGTTGLVIGAIGGGLLGNAIGGDTLSTLLGAGGGALLGRSIDRGNVRCR